MSAGNFGAMRRRNVGRRGLTLMELVVVLSVLAALAAIVVPLFPNLLRRAHKATDATQTSEVAKAVQLYQALYFSYPDNFDALVDSTGAMPSYLPADGGNAFGGYVTPGTLDAAAQAALGRVGIDQIQALAATTTGAGFHPTRNPYAGTIASDAIVLDGTGTPTVAFLNKAAITNGLLQAELASDPTATYVVFGVGARNSMVSKVMMDAPTSVPQNASFTPDTLYSRVGVVFKVSGLEVSRTERARFVAAVALEDDELEATEKDIVGYYEVVRGDAQN